MKKNGHKPQYLITGLMILSIMVCAAPAAVFASGSETTQVPESLTTTQAGETKLVTQAVTETEPAGTTAIVITAPPIIEEAKATKATEITTTETTVTSAATTKSNVPPMYVFMLVFFVLGALAGYAVRSMLIKHQTRVSEREELDTDSAFAANDDDFYGQEPEPESKPKPEKAFAPAANQKKQSGRGTVVEPEPEAEILEPAGVDFYNRTYYYDDSGMPFFKDPKTGESVFYHDLTESDQEQ